MKLAFVLAFLCLIAVVSAANEQQSGYPEHNVKKYEKERHHHHHKKHRTEEAVDAKKYGKHAQEKKKEKHLPKSAPQEISPVEAELQADIVAGRKHLMVEQEKRQQDGIHLQDLAYESEQQIVNREEKHPNQHQKSHHKNGQHSNNRKVSKVESIPEPEEEKLFPEDTAKEHSPKTRPVLEDTFETLNTEKVHKDSSAKKHSKKPKHKKAHEKSKKDKHGKKSKKDKKERQKDKKNKAW